MSELSEEELSDLRRNILKMGLKSDRAEEGRTQSEPGISQSRWATLESQAPIPAPPASAQTKPKSNVADSPDVMRLNVGGRSFETMRATLAQSALFRNSLLAHDSGWVPQPDGQYFLDVDPDIFEHLLRFMRRPVVFPLFWSKTEGFDYALYHRLQTEAKYLQVDSLYKWIKNKNYINAVSVHTLKPLSENVDVMAGGKRQGNYSEDCHVVRRVKKVYICPRGIFVHKGNPDMCGAACAKAQAGCEKEYEEVESVQVTTVGRVVTFDENVCEPA